MEYAAIAKVLFVFSVGLVSPGPDFLMVSSVALAKGRAAAVKCAAGVALGFALFTAICLTGMSAVFMRCVWLAASIKICGGLYLFYLGVSLWRSSFDHRQGEVTVVPKQRRNAFLAGILTNLTNLKVIAFFASVFALALTPETGLSIKLFIGFIIPFETFLWFSFVAFCLSKKSVRAHYERAKRAIDRGVGTVLGFFGARLVIEASSEFTA
ncbi:MAG: LysE family transporter [Alphaproteobacteria bacterium]|nr:LysE family transporter [Alphaproteobacteria bacterium]